MTLAPLPIRRARKAATAIHDRLRIRDAADIDVEGIAALLGLDVRRGGLPGADARLVGTGVIGIIRLSTRIDHEGAQRFSVAHELGHRQLAHRSTALPSCQPAALHVERGAEAEANAFAAELLMPERLLRRQCEVSPVSLDDARAIADTYKVSLVAAALRFVELTSERCAVVFSRAGRVVWAARSATFVPFIERGRRLCAAGVAFDLFRDGGTCDGPQPVPADAWFEHDTDAEVDIIEDAVPVPATAAVLSLIWIPDKAARALRLDRE
ncbi:MAG: ImmA/IrrE family metallo-endopeptidase [Myxococcales bacterium]|nr:ImmA/IrrE family metallo-endopeptidase [Myxococcales bacterium]MCB9521436.1 ImmA/IrrE family metallo-endopeptidase [Myxococcales bacterium]